MGQTVQSGIRETDYGSSICPLPTGPFWDLCQWDLANDPLLKSIHTHLGSTDGKRLINTYEESSTYPGEIRKELHKLGCLLYTSPSPRDRG